MMAANGMKTSLLIAFALFLLTGRLFSTYFGFDAFGFGSSPPPATTCDQPNNGLQWIALSSVALAISILVVAVGWMMSGLFGGPKYEEFLKGKLWDIVETAVLLGMFALLFISLLNYGNDSIDTARAYTKIIRNTAISEFGKTVFGTTIFSFVANANPKIHLFRGNFGSYIDFQLSPMFKPIFDLLGILIQLQTTVVLQWYAHEFVLCFIRNNLLTLFMPIGLFLRACGLKPAGNAILGIAVGLYFVYPFMINQIGQITTKHYENELAALTSQELYLHLEICRASKPICCIGDGAPDQGEHLVIQNGNGLLSVKKILTDPFLGCDYATTGIRAGNGVLLVIMGGAFFSMVTLSLSGAGGGIGAASTMLNLGALFAMIVPMVTFVLGFIYSLAYFFFITSMVLPIFVIFITLTLSKEITKALGTEMDLSALEKLI